jgi:hypothetical protein
MSQPAHNNFLGGNSHSSDFATSYATVDGHVATVKLSRNCVIPQSIPAKSIGYNTGLAVTRPHVADAVTGVVNTPPGLLIVRDTGGRTFRVRADERYPDAWVGLEVVRMACGSYGQKSGSRVQLVGRTGAVVVA